MESQTLRPGDVDDAFGAAWDAMPAARGLQADIYDSWAWHSGAFHADDQLTQSVRIPAVLDGAQPLALCPFRTDRFGTWHSVGARLRPRSRVIIGSEDPDTEALGRLAETVASAGARALALHRLPSRDPATDAWLAALRAAGYRVAARERSADRLAAVDGGWAEHSKSFKSFAKYANRCSSRVARLWDLRIDTYGTSPDYPAAEGFHLYTGLQARSWKGAFDPGTLALRQVLVDRAELLDWARIFVLRIAGEPVAGHVWFRLGSVATWMSTAHDQRLDALSPGTIVQWWSQERIFDDLTHEPPALLDFLPGGSAQKDRLSPERPALLVVDAVRQSLVAGVSVPVRQQVGRAAPAVRARKNAHLRALQERRTQRQAALPSRVRRVEVSATQHPWPVVPLPDDDPTVRRFLAVAAGLPSTEETASRWSAGDTWWKVGDDPVALVRIGADRVLLEVVRLDDDVTIEAVAGAVAEELRARVTLLREDARGDASGVPTLVRRPLLPWPSSLQAKV